VGVSNAGATAFLPLKNPFRFENEEGEPARSEIDVTSVTAAACLRTLKSHKAALNIVKLENPFLRILLRIVAIGILSVVLSILVGWTLNHFVLTPTIGEEAIPILSSEPRSLGEAIGIEFLVDLLVPFVFLFGIWFLWTQGRNYWREQGRSVFSASPLRIGSILAVATVCALPLAYYALLVKSKFHTGLADTPAEVTESFVLFEAICASALCGVAILGRFWPGANPDRSRTQQ